jgi:hypothetical protein
MASVPVVAVPRLRHGEGYNEQQHCYKCNKFFHAMNVE